MIVVLLLQNSILEFDLLIILAVLDTQSDWQMAISKDDNRSWANFEMATQQTHFSVSSPLYLTAIFQTCNS